jgi:hypothetical protein
MAEKRKVWVISGAGVGVARATQYPGEWLEAAALQAFATENPGLNVHRVEHYETKGR